MRLTEGDFVLPVDKPEGPTSHDVVASARRALGTRRVGHTGTLDPFASGLLLVCVGRATRLAEFLSGLEKRYVATAWLGVETDTLDREGSPIPTVAGGETPSEDQVRRVLATLEGTLAQVPPQFSAKKVDGEAMHRRARRGEEVELEPVTVTVHEIALLGFEPPEVRFSVRCSSGTYVRALARDLGRALEVGAHLTALRRTHVGSFSVDDAVTVEDLQDDAAVRAAAIEPVAALCHLDRVDVDDEAAHRLGHGQRVRIGPASGEEGLATDRVAVAHAGVLLAVADLDDGLLRPRKVFTP